MLQVYDEAPFVSAVVGGKFFETLLSVNKRTRRHITDDFRLQHCREDSIFYIFSVIFLSVCLVICIILYSITFLFLSLKYFCSILWSVTFFPSSEIRKVN